jgi:hypothetical protein
MRSRRARRLADNRRQQEPRRRRRRVYGDYLQAFDEDDFYSTSQSAAVTKGIYLRAHQLLILRVEARTPNDDPGTYHIHFAWHVRAIQGGIPVAEALRSPADTSTQKASANRLSSVGATLPKPPAEVTETAEAKPSPSPKKPRENSEATEAAKVEADKPRRLSARNTPARPPAPSTRPSTSRRQPPPKKPEPRPRLRANGYTSQRPNRREPAKIENPLKRNRR